MAKTLLLLLLTFILLPSYSFAQTILLGDLNNDGKVNIFDYNILLGDFDKTGTPGFLPSDINRNGHVDIFDYNTVLSNFGKTVPTPGPSNSPYPPSPSPTSSPVATPTPPVYSQEWSQFGFDAAHTAYNPEALGSNWSLKWLWNNSTGTDHLFYGFDVQPVTGDGNIYIGTINYGPTNKQNSLLAISENSGNEVWSYQADGPIQHTAAYDSQTKNVYFASQPGTVYKISSGGVFQTSKKLIGEIYAAPILVGNTIYIGTTSGIVYAIDKGTLNIIWSSSIGSPVKTPAAYSTGQNLLIVEAENMYVYGINPANGSTVWFKYFGGNNRVSYAHSYPVVADESNSIIIRTDVTPGTYACNLLWDANLSTATTMTDIRNMLTANPALETFFVLDISTGNKKYVAPVVYGAEEQNFGNGCFGRNPPPQPVIKKISSAEDVAYVLWRQGEIRPETNYAARVDVTYGEMNLGTGDIKYVKNASEVNRTATDEQSPPSMAGDILFNNNWQVIGASRVDRNQGTGTASSPLSAAGLYAFLPSIFSGDSCAQNTNHYCTAMACAPPDCTTCDSKYCVSRNSFFIYTSPRFDAINPPQSMGYERRTHVTISNGSIYYRTADGAIMAISTQ